jgi:hypothetical protein
MSRLTNFIAEQDDVDLQLSRRALAVSQAVWDGPVRSVASPSSSVVWHGSSASRETGPVALVPLDGELADLVGNIVRVVRLGGVFQRSVCVYVLKQVDMEGDISLSRRAFLQLGILALEDLNCRIEVVA